MTQVPRSRCVGAIVIAAAILLAGCGSSSPTSNPATSAPSKVSLTAPPSTAGGPSPAAATGSPTGATGSPTGATDGFAFAAEDIVAYYEQRGFECIGREPSPKAVGFFVRSCRKVDDAGRTRIIGVVTDAKGDLADGFAGVLGPETEAVLAPADALAPLAGFLGAALGEDRGTPAALWLADHLGAAHDQTTIGAITIATYTVSDGDPSGLYVEVANQAYLDAAAP